MKQGNITAKRIIGGIFTFLLTVLAAVLILLLSTAMSIFNDRVVIQKLNESNYYNDIYSELNKKAEELIAKAELPDSVLTKVITLERVYVDGKNYIEATLRGEEVPLQTQKLREQLSDNVDQYLKEQNLVITDELSMGVATIITELEELYRQGIELELMKYLHEYKLSFYRLMWVIIPVILALTVVLCYFILQMNRYKHRGVRQISYATLSASVMAILSAGYLLLAKPYRRLEIAPDYYSDFLHHYFDWSSKGLLYMGFMGILVTVILIALVNYMKNRIGSR